MEAFLFSELCGDLVDEMSGVFRVALLVAAAAFGPDDYSKGAVL